MIGSIRIADQVRREAADAIRDLQRMGLQIELLTGDQRDLLKPLRKASV